MFPSHTHLIQSEQSNQDIPLMGTIHGIPMVLNWNDCFLIATGKSWFLCWIWDQWSYWRGSYWETDVRRTLPQDYYPTGGRGWIPFTVNMLYSYLESLLSTVPWPEAICHVTRCWYRQEAIAHEIPEAIKVNTVIHTATISCYIWLWYLVVDHFNGLLLSWHESNSRRNGIPFVPFRNISFWVTTISR